jgi:hypothetical protein
MLGNQQLSCHLLFFHTMYGKIQLFFHMMYGKIQ